MNKFDSTIEKIINLANELKLVAVYSVGVNDGNELSDIDILIVASEKTNINLNARFSYLSPLVDVRRIVTREEFGHQSQYYSYSQMELIFGEQLMVKTTEPASLKKANLVKMASMFFVSFLRNYYRLKRAREKNIATILKNLNDFRYVEFFGYANFEEVILLNKDIVDARNCYPDITLAEVELLLRRSIDVSWSLMDRLNKELKNEFEVNNPRYVHFGKEPTIFLPAETANCRRLTEEAGTMISAAKILYMPLGFQFIFSDDKYVKKYRLLNFSQNKFGVGLAIKTILKQVITLLLYWKFILSDIYEVFSSNEAYSVKRSLMVYDGKHYLMPAEQECFTQIHLSPDAKILDIGCGAGRTTIFLAKDGYKNILGIDVVDGLINRAKNFDKGKYVDYFKVLNVLDLDTDENIQDRSLDCAFFSYNGLDYLYPLSERRRALDQIYKKLKPGGYFIFSSHNSLCVNRRYLLISWKNIIGLLKSNSYRLVDQSFGKLLTYFASPKMIDGELRQIGFEKIAIIPNVKNIFPFRDPFPYYIYQKK
ncbi:class I SAM-dependent methyltransferase [Candidatus Parcubacteria bacterium]|nr:class I SAM-dependent methyltransferase [Patescibacteria group bacterium]MBU4309253.1 class I SAM-dependent methyltransferase [Patescibacteria group bacterium]MBU4432482.1 class I SAM-dependent methyltransferase [Patescibacteria group bacterium]MBU4577614.1 class I SAM-dependent methyltransferase [Patescibacteria group bacterium]MCG2697301.1 class I SAM-dependent methyltransferase [Candidatus Parcubacteria bacterium]